MVKDSKLKEKISGRMDHLTILMVSHVGHLMAKQANRELTRLGFSLQIEQLPILFLTYFSCDELLSQQEIANALQKDKSGIQRSVRTLERDGYLRIVSDEVDRRKNLIQLTPAGKLVIDKVIEVAETLNNRLTEQLPADELSTFQTTLRKIISLLE